MGKVHLGGITASPTGQWVAQQAQNLAWNSGTVAEGCEGQVDEEPEAGVEDEKEHGQRLIVAGLGVPPLSSDGLSEPHTVARTAVGQPGTGWQAELVARLPLGRPGRLRCDIVVRFRVTTWA